MYLDTAHTLHPSVLPFSRMLNLHHRTALFTVRTPRGGGRGSGRGGVGEGGGGSRWIWASSWEGFVSKRIVGGLQ